MGQTVGGRNNAKPTDLCLWGEGLCIPQHTAAPRKVLWGHQSHLHHTHTVRLRPHLGPRPSSLPFTAVDLSRAHEIREVAIRICKTNIQP